VGIYDKYYDEFPEFIKSLDSSEWKELGEIMDGIDAVLVDAIYGMKFFTDPDRCQENLLSYVGYPVSANLFTGDSSGVKRKKVWEAIARHRIKGTEQSFLDCIEEVTGFRPIIIPPYSAYDVWESINNLMPYPYDFMKWASKNSIAYGGFSWRANVGVFGGSFVRGEIYIDLRSKDLSPSVIKKVIDVVEFIGSPYFRYYLGALTEGGWFNYANVF